MPWKPSKNYQQNALKNVRHRSDTLKMTQQFFGKQKYELFSTRLTGSRRNINWPPISRRSVFDYGWRNTAVDKD